MFANDAVNESKRTIQKKKLYKKRSAQKVIKPWLKTLHQRQSKNLLLPFCCWECFQPSCRSRAPSVFESVSGGIKYGLDGIQLLLMILLLSLLS